MDTFINLWFGNFYEPAFSNKEFIDRSMEHIKQLGFDHIQLDSKAWEDFADRYSGGKASEYVEMQEYMMNKAGEAGLSFNFLALYLNGDNLYPNIRFSPPIYGESVTNPDGSDGKWYKYWSALAQQAMIDHVKGLIKTYIKSDQVDSDVSSSYGKYASRIHIDDIPKIPICSMWDPIVAPSFDTEGIQRYRQFLEEEYREIEAWNRKYGQSKAGFDEVNPEDYWFGLDGKNCYLIQDRDNKTVSYQMWVDNMKWKRNELTLYFKSMNGLFQQLDPSLHLIPDLAQWSYFLNVDGRKLTGVGFADLWDTAMRGIDLYDIAPYVHSTSFVAVPVTPSGDPDPYVVSCQHSMMRMMNQDRPFVGGIYFGRYLYNDLYRFITPYEMIGSMTAQGASGYLAYGYCGLDDGGLLYRSDDYFETSLTMANRWMKETRKQLGKRIPSRVAILFPNAMSVFEPLIIEDNEEKRLDLLGYYKACSDLGLSPDVIGISQMAEGILEHYDLLIVPTNNAYGMDANPEAEAKLFNWVQKGGTVLHGPKDELISNAVGIRGRSCDKDELLFEDEKVLVQGSNFETFTMAACRSTGTEVIENEEAGTKVKGDEEVGTDTLVTYLNSGEPAILKSKLGEGNIISVGFMLGYNYVCKVMPHVPLKYKNQALYPIIKLKKNLLQLLIQDHISVEHPFIGKDIEVGNFEHGHIVVNHRHYPYLLPNALGTLEPGTATFIPR